MATKRFETLNGNCNKFKLKRPYAHLPYTRTKTYDIVLETRERNKSPISISLRAEADADSGKQMSFAAKDQRSETFV